MVGMMMSKEEEGIGCGGGKDECENEDERIGGNDDVEGEERVGCGDGKDVVLHDKRGS